MGLDRRQLALEAKHAGGNQRLLGEEAGVVDQKTRGEIVRAIQHNVGVTDQIEDITRIKVGDNPFDSDIGIDAT